jgi:hypothetical protein
MDVKTIIDSAMRLNSKDDISLEILLGLREKAIERNPALKDDPDFEPKYDGQTMGAMNEIKALGRRVLIRWNKEIYGVVCGGKGDDQMARKTVLDSLSLGEAAVIAAVATLLLNLGTAAALASALAPLIVKRFIWPAKDELCAAWGEGITAQG